MGIGREIAFGLAREGATPVLGGRSEKEGAAAANAIKAETGIEALYVGGDITDEGYCRELSDRAVARFGKLTGLVNNAGIYPPVDFFECDGNLFDKVYAVNVRGAYLCSKYAAAAMGDVGGSIVHIGSTHAFGAASDYSVYGTSKGALYSFSAYLARNLARRNIRSNCITVGWVATESELERIAKAGHDLAWLEETGRRDIPLGRLQTGRDITMGAVYLLSDEAAMVTESDIKITGGYVPGYGKKA